MERMQITVSEEWSGKRLDQVLAEEVSDHSRSYFKDLIENEFVTVNGIQVKPSFKCSAGDRIDLIMPDPETVNIEPENIPLDIYYEDDDLLVVNKPKGMVVHPSPGHINGTLVNAVMYHCQGNLSGINGKMRPGIVHRIDKDTTGLLIICKNDSAHQCIAAQLKEHSIKRIYTAICFDNIPEDQGTVDAPIGRNPADRKKMAVNWKNGRNAVTHYKVLERFGRYTLLQCRLETGRTHQIRVHMAYIHHPILGDQVYGPERQPFNLEGQCLHAGTIGFIHPATGEYMEFTAPLPEYFQNLLEKLRKSKMK